MPKYVYTAKDKKGNKVEDVMEAEDENILVDRLHSRGFIIISVFKQGVKKVKKKKESFKFSMKKTITLQELVLFTNQLSAMIDGGLLLVNCLQGLAKESTSVLSKTILKVKDDIKEGETFHDAMAKHPDCFNNLYLGMIKAGETSGELAVILNQLAAYLEKSFSMKQKVKSAIAYPKFMFFISFIMINIILVFIIPRFEEIYSSSDMALPVLTQLLLNISYFMRSHWILFLTLIVSIIFLFKMVIFKNKRILELIDEYKLKIPVFGPLIKKDILARFCKTMSVLVKSGMSITDSLHTAGEGADNIVVLKACDDMVLKVQQGSTLTNAMKKNHIFPEMLIQMVSAGEEVGMIDSMFSKSGTFYEQQVDTTLSTFSSLIEPLLIVVVGSIIAGMIVAVFLPMFHLGEAIR